ncbi:alpha/beta hydrolase [Dyella sp.]|jgi:acetyl esterase/lipase|uniref:alpha/beta hydrolase n=1 Tax=Dyella sp. TaxID=1869338 RepID=UPI002D766E3F|nr:alpha/beta hydrolase [Dyella sp.]HET6430952.1 alpha/beta hydrolase [Dyella sp.]
MPDNDPSARSPRPPAPVIPLRPRRRGLGALLATIAAGLLTGCQATLFAGLNATARDGGVVATHDIAFDARHQLALDVYRPVDARGAPVVVFFYGGSWKSGKRQWYRWAGEALARRGLVVVIPDYRKWPQVRMGGFMQDGARAVAWAHAHASEYGGDPEAMFLMGHSAGAHVGALLATDARWLKGVGMTPGQLRGFIGLAGPYDFLPLTDPDFVDMFGPTHAAQLNSQPVHFVNGDEPPMLLMQGTGDKIVWPRNARSLGTALEQAGESAKVRLYPDIGHFAILFAMSRPLRGKAPVLDDTLAFIREHAGAQAAAALAADRVVRSP